MPSVSHNISSFSVVVRVAKEGCANYGVRRLFLALRVNARRTKEVFKAKWNAERWQDIKEVDVRESWELQQEI